MTSAFADTQRHAGEVIARRGAFSTTGAQALKAARLVAAKGAGEGEARHARLLLESALLRERAESAEVLAFLEGAIAALPKPSSPIPATDAPASPEESST